MRGFWFPNEAHLTWDLMIVLYPYITGLVAGISIVSSLYYLFKCKQLYPVGRLSLIASFVFLLVAPLPLLLHVGRPERVLNIIFTPNLSSPMAIFGLVYIFYLVLLLLEIQIYDRGVVLSPPLGASSTQKAMTVLSCLGIPVACIFHGYVGLVFSSIKANFWWCTLFTPIVFLTSGVVSGIAMLIVIYLFRKDARLDCIHMLCKWLGGFAILTLSAELIHILTLTHLGREKWAITATLLTDQLAVSFIGVQMILGILAIVILGVIVVRGTSLRPRPYKTLACIASLGLLAQVFAMRWNVVLGGQMFSKSLRGLRDDYSLQFLGENGILIAAIIFTIPFILLGIFNRLSPLFPVPPNQDISKL